MIRLTSRWPGSGGYLTTEPNDFCVDETLPYNPSGEGEHLFVRIQKVGLTSMDAARRVARHLNVTQDHQPLPPEAGMAGLKDRHARATQWLSFPWPLARETPEPGFIPLKNLPFDGPAELNILETHRHRHKLRKGHVAHNVFCVTIRGVPPGGIVRAAAILERLRQSGLPNRYGPQRFGQNGQNPAQARAILAGAERPPRNRHLWSLLKSSLQSEIFNQTLDLRIETGLFGIALLGDRMHKHASGGQFTVIDPTVEQPRVDNFEISPTAELPGKRPPTQSSAVAREIELKALERCQIDPSTFPRLGQGARRVLRIPIPDSTQLNPIPSENTNSASYQIKIQLPSGTYATVLLDELIKPEDGPLKRTQAEETI